MRKSIIVISLALLVGFNVFSAAAQEMVSVHTMGSVNGVLQSKGIYDQVFNSSQYISYEDYWHKGLTIDQIERFTGEAFSQESMNSAFPDFDNISYLSENYNYMTDENRDKFFLKNMAKKFEDFEKEDYPNIDKDWIEQRAFQDLESLEIPLLKDIEIDVHFLKRLEMPDIVTEDESVDIANITEEKIAYRVRVNRTINGEIVRGQRMTLGYFNDGSFQKISARWSTINAKTHMLYSVLNENEILEKVYNAINKSTLSDIENLDYETGLMIEDGQLRRVIYVMGNLRGPDGAKGKRSYLIVHI